MKALVLARRKALSGWIFGVLGIWPGGGILGSIIVAFVGAVMFVWISRAFERA